MKYGVLVHEPINNTVNIGDSIMSLGIRSIYKKMGIPDENIINVYYGEFKNKEIKI